MRVRALFMSFGVLLASSGFAVTLFDTDDFTNGSIRGWTNGQSGNGMSVSSGGQGGLADNFLRINSGSTNPPRLAGYNDDARYAGNYLTVGATGIRVSMTNLGSTDLNMRLVLFDSMGGQWTSTNAFDLAAGRSWTTTTFGLAESDLTLVQGSSTYTESMSSIMRIMFRHQSGLPGAQGTQVTGSAGFDKIEVVPEPASLCVLATGLLALRRRNRKN